MDDGARLVEFLERHHDTEMVWGKSDCTAAPAKWCGEIRNVDIVLPEYSTQDEAHALIERAGGLVALWDEYLPMFGERLGAPKLGDIGVIDTRLFGPVGVILGQGGNAFWRSTKSFRPIAPRAFLKVWAVT